MVCTFENRVILFFQKIHIHLLDDILAHIKKCNTCQDLPLGPRPVVTAHPKSKIIIIGQAPGTAVHQSGIPWDDKSGENLRSWMDIEKDVFYDTNYKDYLPRYFVLPHPSPRNNIWQAKNEWFKRDVLPELKAVVSEVL